MKFIVTTSYSPDYVMVCRAMEIASLLKIPYLPRDRSSLSLLYKETLSEGILLVERDKESLLYAGMQFYFHPSMAKLRIKALAKGEKDHLVEALSIKSGDSCLDCTLGLGADAIVISFCLGEGGLIYGLESSPVISLLVKQGLENYHDEETALVKAMRRINVIHTNYEEFLASQPSKSFDTVYFDPMFRRPVEASDALNSIRMLTNNNPISEVIINEALRVARQRVVMKERRASPEFNRLGFNRIIGGKYSPIGFGVIEVEA